MVALPYICLGSSQSNWWSPPFFAPGTRFVEDSFSMDGDEGVGRGWMV